jgi:hypothetical protein
MRRRILIGFAIGACALIAIADWRLSIYFATHVNGLDYVAR